MKKTVSLLLALTLLASVFVGCSGNASPSTSPSASTGTSQSAGTSASTSPSQSTSPATTTSSGAKIATYNIGATPERGVDPGMGQTTSSVNMFVTLNGFLYRSNLNDEWEPELAESHTVSSDGTVWTFKLRPGMKFSTGNPITAEDVKYSWLRALDPINASEYAFILFPIKGAEDFNATEPDTDGYKAAKEAVGIKVIDPLTIEVTLVSSTPYFLQLVGFCTYAVIDMKFCEEVLAAGKVYGESPETTSSAGPFKLTEYKNGEYYMGSKNENYYDAANVKLDGVRFTLIEQSVTELNLWDTGEIDMTILDMSTADLQKYQSENKLTSAGILSVGWLAYNCEREPFNDVRVRQALVKALDLKTIVETVVGVGYIPADGFIPNSMPATDDPTKPFRTKSYINVSGDVTEAKKLLAEAGYPDGAGFPAFKIQYGVTSDQNRAISEAMCAMWKQNLGINGSPDGMEGKARLEARRIGDFDICFQGWGADFADPYTFLECLLSSHYYNYGKYNNPEFDKAITSSATELDATKRNGYLVEAERILMEDMPLIMTFFSAKNYLQSSRLKDVVFTPMGIADSFLNNNQMDG